MLILLPKEILEYILSIIIYDRYALCYPYYAKTCSKTEVIEKLLQWRFYRKYKLSEMAPLVKQLSLIHPRIRQILVQATWISTEVFQHRTWQFRERFFLTLNGTLEKK